MDHQAASVASANIDAMPTTRRLNKEMAAAALEIVAEQILTTSTMAINRSGAAASFADEETLEAARTLFTCVMQHKLCEHVMREVDRRSMLPVTVFSLSTLFCEAMALHKLK